MRILVFIRCFYGGFVFFQAEDGIRDLVRSRGLGDVYKRQGLEWYGFHRPALPMYSRSSEPVRFERDCAAVLVLSLIHI